MMRIPTEEEARLRKMEKVYNMVEDLLRQMKTDNAPDPVHFLTQAMEDPDFDRRASVSGDDIEELADYCSCALKSKALSIVVIGASGDLAKKKTFPALFTLFRSGLLPPCTSIVGYARSPMTMDELEARIAPFLPKDALKSTIKKFFGLVTYCSGPYDHVSGFETLNTHLLQREAGRGGPDANRIFYLALPPTAFVDTCRGIKGAAVPANGWIRIIVEKPFGRDTDSSHVLAADLGKLFNEDQLYRIDHYLGKEMVQNLVTLRFANHVFSALWSNRHIKNVQITFKETIGTQGRGGYFDNFGIIRDVIQNHLTQILALVSMEKPKSLSGEHIRDEKVAVLQCVKPVEVADCVLGQYTAKPGAAEGGYLDDPTVPKGSHCPTFASLALFVKNDRWDGVPFIIKAGKALNEKVVVIRIQFRDEILPFGDATGRNELVIRAQPDEAMYLKIAAKAPGINQDVHMTELDLTYKDRYDGLRLPDAYESLINEVVVGNTTNFVRSDELDAAWRIFTPLLHKIDAGEIAPIPYEMGSRGPVEADELAARYTFKRSSEYKWASHRAGK